MPMEFINQNILLIKMVYIMKAVQVVFKNLLKMIKKY